MCYKNESTEGLKCINKLRVFALFWHFHKTYKLFVKANFIMLTSIHLVLFRHPINEQIPSTVRNSFFLCQFHKLFMSEEKEQHLHHTFWPVFFHLKNTFKKAEEAHKWFVFLDLI